MKAKRISSVKFGHAPRQQIVGDGQVVDAPDATIPKRKRRYSYDQACSDLAVYFLTDGRRDIDHDSEVAKELAQAIQDVCEDHCRDFERG